MCCVRQLCGAACAAACLLSCSSCAKASSHGLSRPALQCAGAERQLGCGAQLPLAVALAVCPTCSHMLRQSTHTAFHVFSRGTAPACLFCPWCSAWASMKRSTCWRSFHRTTPPPSGISPPSSWASSGGTSQVGGVAGCWAGGRGTQLGVRARFGGQGVRQVGLVKRPHALTAALAGSRPRHRHHTHAPHLYLYPCLRREVPRPHP